MMHPKLRFREFRDEWESKKFQNIATRVSKHSDERKLPRITFDNINANQGTLNSITKSSTPGIEFENDNVLFGKLRPYLNNIWLASFKGIAIGDFWVLKSSNGKFLYSLIQTNRYKFISNLTAGTKMPRSDWNLVSKYQFKIPQSNEEQSQIASFFTKLDKLINLQQSRLEHLKKLKQGYLQKLFTNENSDVPKMRFKGFRDLWESKKLEDVSNILTGRSKFAKGFNETKINKYKVLGASGVISFSSDYDYDDDFILIGRVGSAGNMYRYSGKVKISDNTMLLTTKNTGFIYNLLKTINIKKLSFGSNQPLIKSSELKIISIKEPSTKEQSKIASLLEKLDQQITLNEDKLNHLKQVKRGYLQKMFI